jgi:hypothetical protein
LRRAQAAWQNKGQTSWPQNSLFKLTHSTSLCNSFLILFNVLPCLCGDFDPQPIDFSVLTGAVAQTGGWPEFRFRRTDLAHGVFDGCSEGCVAVHDSDTDLPHSSSSPADT